jgi:hypothetical protein
LSDCWQQILQNSWFVFSFPEKFKPEGKPVSSHFVYRLLSRFNRPHFKTCSIPDMNQVLANHTEIKVFYGDCMLSDIMLQNRDISKWKLRWENGKLTEPVTKRTYLYFHFYKLKQNAGYAIQNTYDFSQVKSFTIAPESIVIEK